MSAPVVVRCAGTRTRRGIFSNAVCWPGCGQGVLKSALAGLTPEAPVLPPFGGLAGGASPSVCFALAGFLLLYFSLVLPTVAALLGAFEAG